MPFWTACNATSVRPNISHYNHLSHIYDWTLKSFVNIMLRTCYQHLKCLYTLTLTILTVELLQLLFKFLLPSPPHYGLRVWYTPSKAGFWSICVQLLGNTTILVHILLVHSSFLFSLFLLFLFTFGQFSFEVRCIFFISSCRCSLQTGKNRKLMLSL